MDLGRAFGFEERERFSEDHGTVSHVTMVLDELQATAESAVSRTWLG